MSDSKEMSISDAIKHLEGQEKDKKKKKEAATNRDFERCERSIRASQTHITCPPPSEEYRENYEKVFGHK